MNKLRRSLATLALIATVGGSILLPFLGAGSMANAASSHHAGSASSTHVVGKSTSSVALRPNWPCPGGTTADC